MKIEFDRIEDAFLFVSLGRPYEHMAYLCKESGKIYYYSEFGDNLEELPDDLDDPKYITIPHKRELGLGRDLALEFAYKFIRHKADYVEYIFSQKGAYARFKRLLDKLGELQHWYQYEVEAQRKALLQWCKENGIEVIYDFHSQATPEIAEKSYEDAKKISKFTSDDQKGEFCFSQKSTDIDETDAEEQMSSNSKSSEKTISLCLPETLLKELKLLAAKKDISYQSLIKEFLAERVQLELNKLQK
jgi:predicted DNA binding CopG/RHH family protein